MEEREKKLRARRRVLLPFYVLVCGLAATALATYLVNQNIDFRNRQQVKDARHQLERTIQSRMESYIGLLRGGAGLFAAVIPACKASATRFHFPASGSTS